VILPVTKAAVVRLTTKDAKVATGETVVIAETVVIVKADSIEKEQQRQLMVVSVISRVNAVRTVQEMANVAGDFKIS
jgi:hypothetical protein